ncbi:hypothetical protein ACFQE5_10625 [Pseudonocardia hispaniensis]|uniref:DUF3263 domain-containing protein n=1 Tax=Pseudonocardia hispaniensis TaxID=904933 RepID=A0ABW1J210_9PSEU
MSAGLSPAELVAARRRFEQDQVDAEYVEYTEAMERISRPRHWRRARARFLRARGYRQD